MAEGLLIALSMVLLILGTLGAFLPVLPGPPLSFAGMLILHFTSGYSFSGKLLVIFGLLAAIITVVDLVLPVYGTKRTGGSKRGMYGAALGLVAGIFFFPPAGILVGPFVGALVAELSNNQDLKPATRAAFGSLLGLLAGALLKLIYSLAVVWVCLRLLFFG
ncbi:MAG: DUF456 domain-containing protein [Bacteroidales bacterium]|jgi:uncharacterized protein YqgC (DUF456 family)|nr:DUF456 domain-containing protein [Bacteroidales bacterium]NLM93166.1 DUF456 domain-containing protein [Bacteroidales bacterium]